MTEKEPHQGSDTLPLEGTLVVALEQAVAAPFATRKLADAGARVIKVERPGGDFARRYDHVARGQSAYFVWLNRGKESLVLDIKDSEDAGLLDLVLARADVYIQNLAPGAASRAGFGSAALRERHPRLVTCDISGYGEEGPYSEMKAYDNLVQAESGIHGVTGQPNAPAKVGISICDIGAGMYAYGSILEALLLRERTGEGAGLEVSLFSAMADWMSVPYLHAVYGGEAPKRMGLSHASIAPYGAFASRDGELVLLSIQNEPEWERFCEEVLRRPGMAEDHRFRTGVERVRNRPALHEAIEEVFSSLTTVEVVDRLHGARIAYGRLNSVEEFARHPQLRVMEIESPGGTIALPADPVLWSSVGGRPHPRVPDIGEHSSAIRDEFRDQKKSRDQKKG
jgi:crotonobetainyl-CoA:carnitine CoA-transferase CaiB-like acyl-CoA transferase